MASNTGSVIDPDFNESADWIELYNTTSLPYDVSGYFLTDNFKNPSKWKIPPATVIGANGFLIIWADSRNAGLHTGFNLSADGEEIALINTTGKLIDSISFGLQKPDISMGRKMDGDPEWVFFSEPTPGRPNITNTFNGITLCVPQFSVPGGIFKTPVSVEITNTFGGEIRYTADGSEPTENSSLVTGTISIDSTTILRARIYQKGKIPGKVVTNTYFIDAGNKIGSLPVVSIATNPENFWDPVKGIYVQDFKPDWEIPVNIELFENDNSDRAAFNLAAGLKINGLYSWQLPQKMLGVYFRKQYGENRLEYPLLFDLSRNSYKTFALRASGSDWAYTLFRDGMIQTLTIDNMEVDYQGFRACVVFVNGKYMGIHNMRSKIDEDFIVQCHNLGETKIDMVENENYAESGTLDQYNELKLLFQKDLSVKENFDKVAANIDVENFTDFMVTEIYSQNTSVDHNIMAWKPQDRGKWKWILNDLDRGFFNPDANLINYYVNREVVPLRNLLRNNAYRKYFGKKLADHLFTTFNPERVNTIIDQFSNNIRDELPKHILRWKGTSSSYGNPIPSVSFWESEVEKLKTFASKRPAALLDDLKNYGFDSPEQLTVLITPANAGTVNFNGLKITQPVSNGAYPGNESITLEAENKGGYVFRGWNLSDVLIEKEDFWKYNDTGATLPENWASAEYNDSDWPEGQAEFGYGDGDEKTVVSYGLSSRNKNITTFFRKSFTIKETTKAQMVKISLKCDDGAVVYINGVEVVRKNLPAGKITFNTLATSTVSGTDESRFFDFSIEPGVLVPGKNTVAVEIHQDNPAGADISFDLELIANFETYNNFVSTSTVFQYFHSTSKIITAVFGSDGNCTLPEKITAEMVINKDCSPCRIPNNVKITGSGKLVIGPGVEIWMSDGVSVEINGSLTVNGTAREPVVFRSDPQAKNKKWGNLNFVNANTSFLNNVIIENASKGKHPVREIAAISVFNSVLRINGAVLENNFENPIVARYSDINMKNSRLHSEVSGDLINVKYGKAYIDSSYFWGNDLPDNDGIDYDGIENGVIKNSVIHDFRGFNSDAIDIGEKSKNILVENVMVYNILDKGVSAGQQSTVTVRNSVFANCGMGAGVKDSSRVLIDYCTFYGNVYSVACYEKNEGNAGGNGVVTNSILSNSYEATVLKDDKSTLSISNSVSDNDLLPPAGNNKYVNPLFINPNVFDFRLAQNSPCLLNGQTVKTGAAITIPEKSSLIYISAIAYKSDLTAGIPEFVELSNSGEKDILIGGFEFTKGITFRFPQSSVIGANKKIYISGNADADFWKNRGQVVYQWESGRLADEGEILQLKTPQGMIADQLYYNHDNTWPKISTREGIVLKSATMDNHFGENWGKLPLNTIVKTENTLTVSNRFLIYPNPTSGVLNIESYGMEGQMLNIYNLSGALVMSDRINSSHLQIDIGWLPKGVYVVRSGQLASRVVLMR